MVMFVNPHWFGSAGAPVKKRWGITLLSCAHEYVALAGLEMATVVGGADLCASRASAVASSTNPGADGVTALFDGNASTKWGANGSGLETIEVVWSVGVSVGAVRLRARDDGLHAQAPLAYVVWARDEVTDTRVVYQIVTGLSAWTSGQVREQAVGSVAIADTFANARIWMLNFTATNGSLCILREMEFANAAGGATICVGGTAGASSCFSSAYEATRLTDGLSNEWAARNGDAFGKALYVFPSAANPLEYSLTARASGGGDAPKNWTLSYGVNGVDFTQTNAETNQTAWAANQRRSYSITHP